MAIKLNFTPRFQRELKILVRKYPSLKKEFEALANVLLIAPQTGTPLGMDCYKIRLAIKSKGRGKSGGARIITYVQIISDNLYFLTIYDKSEQETIYEATLAEIIRTIKDDEQ